MLKDHPELHVYNHTFFKWRVEGCCENFNRLIQLWQNVWLAYFHCNKWVFRFIMQVQVVVFRYSGSGIQIQYSSSVFRYGHSCLGIQAQYSGLCLCTHIQYSYSGIQVENSGNMNTECEYFISTSLYTQACIPKPEF